MIQQLLLNDKAPEGSDNKPHELKLVSTPGKELALSPDGQLVAACASTGKGQTRVWSLESGIIVVDIPYLNRNVPKQEMENIFGLGCDSISFSPDGKYMAVLSELANLYANEADLTNDNNLHAGFNATTMKYANGMTPDQVAALEKSRPPLRVVITGIALFETNTWKLERFFYRPAYKQPTFNSRPLFDAESKTVSAVLFDKAPGEWNKWAGNRIVRWDITTGAQLEEKDMPQLVNSPNSLIGSIGNLWWKPLLGRREVWWREESWRDWVEKTDKEAEQCKQNPPPSPTFVSDEKSNCAYRWLLTTLNLDTGRIRYLVPSKKNASSGSSDGMYGWAGISPDGAHIALVSGKGDVKKRVSTIEILNRETLQLEGSYSAEMGIFEPVFSGNSKYLAISFYKPSFYRSSYGPESAIIFELPKNNHKQINRE